MQQSLPEACVFGEGKHEIGFKAMLLTAEVAEECAEERKGGPSSAASAKTSATSAVGFTEVSPLDQP